MLSNLAEAIPRDHEILQERERADLSPSSLSEEAKASDATALADDALLMFRKLGWVLLSCWLVSSRGMR